MADMVPPPARGQIIVNRGPHIPDQLKKNSNILGNATCRCKSSTKVNISWPKISSLDQFYASLHQEILTSGWLETSISQLQSTCLLAFGSPPHYKLALNTSTLPQDHIPFLFIVTKGPDWPTKESTAQTLRPNSRHDPASPMNGADQANTLRGAPKTHFSSYWISLIGCGILVRKKLPLPEHMRTKIPTACVASDATKKWPWSLTSSFKAIREQSRARAPKNVFTFTDCRLTHPNSTLTGSLLPLLRPIFHSRTVEIDQTKKTKKNRCCREEEAAANENRNRASQACADAILGGEIKSASNATGWTV
ncbi:hypothetical protein ACLOJK_008108 [Asimina triloba]